MHAQRAHAGYLAGRGAHYLLIVKRNQPGLHAQLAALPWRAGPVATRPANAGTAAPSGAPSKSPPWPAGWPSPTPPRPSRSCAAAERREKWSTETCYAVTSLTATQASPAQLAAIIRGHWAIEDRLHWVRDMTFGEDRSQVRTASGPRVMASLRNLAITILRLAGAASIAAALRYHARRPGRPTPDDHEVLIDFAETLVLGGPRGEMPGATRPLRSAAPTLDTAPTHKDSAPARRTGANRNVGGSVTRHRAKARADPLAER